MSAGLRIATASSEILARKPRGLGGEEARCWVYLRGASQKSPDRRTLTFKLADLRRLFPMTACEARPSAFGQGGMRGAVLEDPSGIHPRGFSADRYPGTDDPGSVRRVTRSSPRGAEGGGSAFEESESPGWAPFKNQTGSPGRAFNGRKVRLWKHREIDGRIVF